MESNRCEKSQQQLTGFFFDSINQELEGRVRSITPTDPAARGCQLSLEIQLEGVDGKAIYEKLEASGVRTDWREPNVIRAAPVPLYNSFEDVWNFVACLKEQLS